MFKQKTYSASIFTKVHSAKVIGPSLIAESCSEQ